MCWGRRIPYLGEGVAVAPVQDWFIITIPSTFVFSSLSPSIFYFVSKVVQFSILSLSRTNSINQRWLQCWGKKLEIGRCRDLVTVWKRQGGRNVRRKCNPADFANPKIWPCCPAPPANEEEGRDFLLLQQCDANKLCSLCSQPSVKLRTMFSPSSKKR